RPSRRWGGGKPAKIPPASVDELTPARRGPHLVAMRFQVPGAGSCGRVVQVVIPLVVSRQGGRLKRQVGRFESASRRRDPGSGAPINPGTAWRGGEPVR